MIKNNNYLDSLSKSLLDDVRAVMEGKKSCSKECKCEKCAKEEKGEKEDEKAEMKNEAYDKVAVDKAIKSSRQKISGREGRLIHKLLQGHSHNSDRKPKWTKDEADAHVAKIKADNKGVKEEVEQIDELTDMGSPKFDAESGKDFKRVKHETLHHMGGFQTHKYVSPNHKRPHYRLSFSELTSAEERKEHPDWKYKGNIEFHPKKFSTRKEAAATGRKLGQEREKKHFGEEVEIDEAKAESPIKGTRLISKHQGKDGHHAEVRHNPDWNEYQVHHYENGKHMGEGPVSYHDSKEDAKETAEYEVKHYRPKGGSLHQVKESINEEVDFTKVRKQFDRNEDRNEHSKNAVLVAKHCGSEVDHNEAKDILKKHNELGHLSGPLMARRSALYDKLKKTDNYKKIFPEENVKEEAEIDEAKKMKGEDPCWKNYKMVGTKKGKGGKEVPNCVPEETEVKEALIGKQHKIDKNKNGKLDKQDFEMLRKDKGKWKSVSEKGADGKWSSKDVKEETIEEKLNPSMGASKYIDDFVKSKDPRFEGKSKKERIKMALGAYYGAKNESVEIDEDDTIEEAYGKKRDHKPLHINVNGKYIATTTWAKNAEEAKTRFLKQHPEHKNKRITVQTER